ncbi:TraX family protein [Paenibacillus agilis]|uniref:Conjugal transfer protein TraX n=1 Tax=Paenibacillus agilis TaxID=3020863 RepID=A0A559J2H2_9BACL|nr:hypothetical protein FPZ44_13960 [Paenibacillus agilis]
MIQLIAYCSMMIDHLGIVLFPSNSLFRIIGRLALPLFAYGIAVGFSRTSNVTKYGVRLLIVGIISQVPYTLLFGSKEFNVCFTLLFGLIIIKIIKSKVILFLKIIYTLGLCIICEALAFEYGLYGIALTVFFSVFKQWTTLLIANSILVFIYLYFYESTAVQYYSLLAIPCIMVFEKKSFHLPKIIRYAFYPSHILVLLIIVNYIN